MSKYRVKKASGRWWVLNPSGYAFAVCASWHAAMATADGLGRAVKRSQMGAR